MSDITPDNAVAKARELLATDWAKPRPGAPENEPSGERQLIAALVERVESYETGYADLNTRRAIEHREQMKLVGELEALQARIDAAVAVLREAHDHFLSLLDEPHNFDGFSSGEAVLDDGVTQALTALGAKEEAT